MACSGTLKTLMIAWDQLAFRNKKNVEENAKKNYEDEELNLKLI